MPSVRIIGNGRAGGSFAGALAAIGWGVEVLDRDDDVRGAAGDGADLALLCVPDGAVGDVADAIAAGPAAVAHVSGSLGLAPLAGHERRAVVHPLVSMPEAATGAARLGGAWFGLAAGGDPVAADLVAHLGGRVVIVAEEDWGRYHAAAAIAANHLVGLLGQVERVAATVGVPLEAYLDLAAGSVVNVAAVGPAAALTGPVRRGDWATVERHLEVLPEDERESYRAGVELCRRLLP